MSLKSENLTGLILIKFIILLFLFNPISGCIKTSKPGIIGIEVPTGDGKISSKKPYLISGVFENSPAHKAGIKPGDIIIQINKVVLKNQVYADVYNNMLKGEAGTKVTIVVKRGKETLVFDLIRAEVEQ